MVQGIIVNKQDVPLGFRKKHGSHKYIVSRDLLTGKIVSLECLECD